jgi:hypothetical protein
MAETLLPPELARPPVRRTRLALIAALWRRLTQNLGAGYKPERHYMRGPGPKWHARNSSLHRW